MEIEIHLREIHQILENLAAVKRNGGFSPVLYDIEKLAQAVNYLLETSDIKKPHLEVVQ